MTEYQTEQERFWAGAFGDEYTARNRNADLVASNTAFFSRVLTNTTKVRSVIEYGANIGLNLLAIRHLLPEAQLTALEINNEAVAALRSVTGIDVIHGSVLEFEPDQPRDFVLVKGLLIHVNPDRLEQVYNLLHASTQQYICIAEYYNPTPVELTYRGNSDRLFKRDFAGEMLDRFDDLSLVDYGFVYHRDRFPQDDITWFLLQKTQGPTAR